MGWTYLSRLEVARARAQMDEHGSGVRDEIGFLALHQGYADRFFPGTSVLHTRIRYALFVPWLFLDVAGRTGAAAERALRKREAELARRLALVDQRGVIGRYAAGTASQWPSVVYWNALATWGLVHPRPDGGAHSRSQVHRLLAEPAAPAEAHDRGVGAGRSVFAELPARPAQWNRADAPLSLALGAEEADFFRHRLAQLRNRDGLSLLARLVQQGKPAPDSMWASRVFKAAGTERAALERARQASSLVEVGRCVYDALVEGRLEEEGVEPASQMRRRHLRRVADEHRALACALDIHALEHDMGRLSPRLLAVLADTQRWLGSASADERALWPVYAQAEARKGARARLADTLDGRNRRLEWAADARPPAAGLHYRWKQVADLLDDLAVAA